jgi:hypothetical protein
MTVKKREKRPSSLVEIFTTVEIFIYRSAVLISFLIYAFKHIKAEWLGP